MSEPSNWSLSKGAERVILDPLMISKLEDNALTSACFPASIGFYPSAYRHEMMRSEHDDYLLMYCVGGRGSLVVNGQSQDISSGDLVMLPPGVPHYYASSTSEPWSLFWVHFSGTDAEIFFTYLGFGVGKYIAHGISDVGLQTAFYQLLSHAKRASQVEQFILLSSQLRQLLSFAKCSLETSHGDKTPDAIQSITDYMTEHLDRRLTLDDLLAQTHYSKYHFIRQYKEKTGYTPLKHFEVLKIEQAKLMLESSNLSITEIAYQLAFDDPLYFSRVFRKSVGAAPRKYRANMKTI